MISIQLIRENPTYVIEALSKRGIDASSDIQDVLDYDALYREALQKGEELKAERNKMAKDRVIDPERSRILKEDIAGCADQTGWNLYNRDDILERIPNIPDNDVPYGLDENANIVKSMFSGSFEPLATRDHVALGEKYGLEFDVAVDMSGPRYSFMRGPLATLERAIGQFMLDQQIGKGFQECSVPLIVHERALFGTGQLPKFLNDLYQINDDQFLIPTSEVPLTNYVRNKILNEEELPLRLTALTPCFRSEAGSAGRDTRGILRQHQFNKVEMVSITTAEKSKDEHEFMLSCAEDILKKLDIKYRVMLLCGGDMGFGARKTYDIEAWIPSQNTYREISSVSNCGDFQANRMKTRLKSKQPVHTLNGSGLAVGRTLIAVMENYQDSDGLIAIPDALKSYIGRDWL